ncbi:ATP-dependent transcription regulator LuxR [Roseibium sp. TrichSKD4]|uniref:helix-turn-helix transcriptional regulator n=1 Tax=Roseibium sp. TrichSKD4 TaxID=744980 RepID=UPI0001E568CA|nr:LuxR family transcriptional regulator [Roseibium sp. TrichSKD4]EFO31299.1 ATP-dependent transcription regulator LuxR [Roseibium sp. TrichSKD4]
MHSNEAQDLVHTISNETDLKSVWAKACGYFSGHGFNSLIYADINSIGESLILSNAPTQWIEHYEASGYASCDPFFKYCCNTYGSLRTGSAYLSRYKYLQPKERQLILDASEAGLTAGFSSVFRTNGTNGCGGWNILSDAGSEHVDQVLQDREAEFHFLANFLHLRMKDVALHAHSSAPVLTRRELECLKWLSAGLRTAELADKLAISGPTVEFHIKNAREKLSAKTREQAVARAVSLKLL